MRLGIVATCLWAGLAWSEDFYLAQNARGTGDGASAANARAVAFFNSSANWGPGPGVISPGDTVFLVGVILTDLTFQGSGTANGFITVDGTRGSMAATFNVVHRSWWKVQNVTWSGPNALISILGGAHGVFTGNTTDSVSQDPAVFLGQYADAELPDAITISNNVLRSTAADLGNAPLDLIKTDGSTNVVVEGNVLELRAGGAGGLAHDDCLETSAKAGASGGPPANWTVRFNRFVMNSAATADRSWMLLQDLAGTNRIYGNVFVGVRGAEAAQGLDVHRSAGSQTAFEVHGNTFVTVDAGSNTVLALSGPGTASIRNNVFRLNGQVALAGTMTVVRDHNFWVGLNLPPCDGGAGELCTGDVGFWDPDAGDYSLTAGSPARGSGAVLGAPFDQGPVAHARWPAPVLGQRTASWDRGAMVFSWLDGDAGVDAGPGDAGEPDAGGDEDAGAPLGGGSGGGGHRVPVAGGGGAGGGGGASEASLGCGCQSGGWSFPVVYVAALCVRRSRRGRTS
jgi:hypothetical protein